MPKTENRNLFFYFCISALKPYHFKKFTISKSIIKTIEKVRDMFKVNNKDRRPLYC